MELHSLAQLNLAEQIGSGSYGTVYRAECRNNDVKGPIALKVTPTGVSDAGVA